VVAKFDQRDGSSDGGAVLLAAADRRLGLCRSLSECLADRRDPWKVRHEVSELVHQRVYGIAAGYPDGNDTARLSGDPVFKMLLGRDPITGDRLASQPTLSRFENEVGRNDLVRIGTALFEAVVARHKRRLGRRVRRITLDLDPSADATHGAQQLSFFNGFYDTYCYLPMLGFLRFNDEREQYLFAAMLRPGNSPDKSGALAILRRIVPRLRAEFRKARIFVRLDAGFAAPEILEYLDEEPRVDYVVAIARNKVLLRKTSRLLARARRLSRESGESERVFGECRYRARSWSRERRVVCKAEVVRFPGRDPKDNPRFVVTNLRPGARHVYEREYCARGDVENRIKELQHDLAIGRTSCSRFLANQFRVMLTAAAYALLQEIRRAARQTSCARAQAGTLRERLLKIGAHVVVSVRRIVMHLPESFAYLDCWRRVAKALAFRGG
jgi:hypothetical protein